LSVVSTAFPREGCSVPATRSEQAPGTKPKPAEPPPSPPLPGPQKSKSDPKRHKRSILYFGLGAVALIALAGLGGFFWLQSQDFESTDDAYIDAHIVRLAPQVSGVISHLLVKDNELVAANQVLLTIDSAQHQVQLAQYKAQRAQLEAQNLIARQHVAQSRTIYRQALANLAASQAVTNNAARQSARYLALQSQTPGAVSRQEVDQATALASQTQAETEALSQAAKDKAQEIQTNTTLVKASADQIGVAQSTIDAASLTLGYDEIRAPVAGHITEQSSAVGNYVQPGTQILAIVPLNLWITANFKETQLAHMRPGQTVSIHVDACPGKALKGHVQSIQRGAGQAFGILPAENATGNFVKVVQRVPVKILLDPPVGACLLGPGMSVEPTVRIK